MTLDREDIQAIAAEVVRLLKEGQGQRPEVVAEEPPPITPEMTERERVRVAQAKGRFIEQTQGMAAYKAFWKEQGRMRKAPRAARS